MYFWNIHTHIIDVLNVHVNIHVHVHIMKNMYSAYFWVQLTVYMCTRQLYVHVYTHYENLTHTCTKVHIIYCTQVYSRVYMYLFGAVLIVSGIIAAQVANVIVIISEERIALSRSHGVGLG